MTRDQIGMLVCPNNANPNVVVNRIMKRLVRDKLAVAKPRTKDQSYIYMSPSNTDIRQINHALEVVDLYFEFGQPTYNHFIIEPLIMERYKPDIVVYTGGKRIVTEVQRTRVSRKDMQEKVDNFMRYSEIHKSKTLWIKTDLPYKLEIEQGFTLIQSPKLDIFTDIF